MARHLGPSFVVFVAVLWLAPGVLAQEPSRTGMPGVDRQAADLKAFALEHFERVLPLWTPEQREFAAESVRLALLGGADQPLSQRQLDDLRSAAVHSAHVNYKHIAHAELEFQRRLWAWRFADILQTPSPDPADVQHLQAQLRELASYTRDAIAERFRLDAGAAQRAVEHAAGYLVNIIEQPGYRFDRIPMTPGQIRDARADVHRVIEEQEAKLEARERRRAQGYRAGASEGRLAELDGQMRQFAARWAATSAVVGAVRKHLKFRDPPEDEEFAELRRRAGAVGDALRRAQDLSQRLSGVASVVASMTFAPDPIAACPAVPVADISAEEAAIVGNLRGALGSGSSVEFSARVESLTRLLVGASAQQFDVHYRLKPGLARMQVVVPIDPQAERNSPLDGATAVYEITPDEGRTISSHGDAVQVLTLAAAQQELGTGAPPVGRLSPTKGPAIPRDLVLMASMADPGQYLWRRSEGLGLPDGIEFFEARLKEPLNIPAFGEVTSLRYRFDTRRQCVLRVTAATARDKVVWQTVYADFKALPHGSAVALRATTTLGDGPLAARREAHSGSRAALHWVGYRVVTRYEWFAEAGVRLPVSGEVEDDKGNLECVMVFRDHEVEPAEDQ